jgi:hypothetical protein
MINPRAILHIYTHKYISLTYIYIDVDQSYLPFPEGAMGAVVLKPTFPSAGIAACHWLHDAMGVRCC